MTTTHQEYRKYGFTIHSRPREPASQVTFLDFPEILTSSDPLASAFAHACAALDLHLESLQKLGNRVPKPKHTLVVESV